MAHRHPNPEKYSDHLKNGNYIQLIYKYITKTIWLIKIEVKVFHNSATIAY